MTEASSKSKSSLAVADKRSQKSSGCVGVIFQLLDWNRRLTKKKLFPKKLFPPVDSRKASNKFGTDEKFPVAKHLFIPPENHGGFPGSKRAGKDRVYSSVDIDTVKKNRMGTPGLMARLMGLESMPVVHCNKSKKASGLGFFPNGGKSHSKPGEAPGSASSFCYDHHLKTEKRPTKADLRPRKLQKTSFLDRRAVTKVRAEVLQLKNVLPRSRKQHSRLASPVQNPKILSGKNAVRLMGAVTKILEPGLQATNRARCSLTSSSSRISQNDQDPLDSAAFSQDQVRQPTYSLNFKSSNKQSTCSSCANFDEVGFIPNVKEKIADFESSSSELTSEFSNTSSTESGNRMKPSMKSVEPDSDAVVKRSVFPTYDRSVSLAAQRKVNLPEGAHNLTNRTSHVKRNQSLRSLGQECKPQTGIHGKLSNQKSQNYNHAISDKDRLRERAMLFNNEIRRESPVKVLNKSEDYVPSNGNSHLNTLLRESTRALDDYKIKTERASWEKKDVSLPMVKSLALKRRPANCSRQVEHAGFVNSTRTKQRNDPIDGRNVLSFPRSINCGIAKAATLTRAEGNGTGINKDASASSYLLNSRKKHQISSMGMDRRYNNGIACDPYHKKELILDEDCEKFAPAMRVPMLEGDTLGALLEQKLKELTCLESDEYATGDTLSRKSAAIIQELISALSICQPVIKENIGDCSETLSSKESMYCTSPIGSDCAHVVDVAHCCCTEYQMESKGKASLQFLPVEADCDHPSPTSILEASFSNDSSFSENLHSSGYKLHEQSGSTQYLSQIHDPELLDSAASSSLTRNRFEAFRNVASVLGFDADEIGLMGTKLNYVRDVIMNVEILVGILAEHGSADSMGPTVIVLLDSLFLDELEALLNRQCGSIKRGLGIGDAKRSRLRGFLFDCVVESLDARYMLPLPSDFRDWYRLPLPLSRGSLALEICSDIRKWRILEWNDLRSMVLSEASYSLGGWMDFKPKVYDMGVEIEKGILQFLIEDFVIDLWMRTAIKFN